jgi:hypothetical protein
MGSLLRTDLFATSLERSANLDHCPIARAIRRFSFPSCRIQPDQGSFLEALDEEESLGAGGGVRSVPRLIVCCMGGDARDHGGLIRKDGRSLRLASKSMVDTRMASCRLLSGATGRFGLLTPLDTRDLS